MSKLAVEIAETWTLEGAPVPAPPVVGLPVAGWDRYEVLELLGKGGMGAVYRARDLRLGRTVAIKFLLGAHPDLAIRFLNEARAQARIDHPNICRVYEVGEVAGRAYIALQLVEGEPLREAAARMSLDEKIAVLRDVAAAIHEAHRLGIVHRDLKPANIMVERTEDGRWVPIVMDFGLAHELTVEAGITETGALLGTPAYMSPEQALGNHAIDRRTDVYGLGATLYELLTGRTPFPGTSLAETLARVIHDDPPAPRGLVPSLPADLETIALKCLAKQPTQRYPSARALAEDLGRYLDGEPILGRRLSRWQRLRLRARRHRALVVLGAWSLAAILVVGALGVRAWIGSIAERERTAERTRLAERLGREATGIESFLRESSQWPLHDTRPDRRRVRERMRAIAATRHDLGDLGDAVVHDALGRGHLALHEWPEAAAELGRAKAAGRRSPELHAALGRALGELYRHALEEARRSDDKEWIARRKGELARQYLAPVLAEIEESRASGEDPALLDALVALYRRDFAAAEAHARAVAERSPGLPDARKLAADAAYGAALEAIDRGAYDAARPALERATALYAEASEIARSDASLYDAAARAWLKVAELDFIQGRMPGGSLERALALLDDRALRANPDDASAQTTKADVLLHWSRTSSVVEAGQRESLLDRSAEAATAAVKLAPHDALAWIALGNARLLRGIGELRHGRSEPWLNRAIEALDRALAIQPNHRQANQNLGKAHRWLATSLEQAGRDPRPAYRAALRSYERVTAIDPRWVAGWSNQAELHVTVAEYDDAVGDDPRASVDSARRAGEQGLAINPNYFYALESLARAELTLAHHLVETDGDPTAALARARAYLDRDEAVHPGYVALWYFRLFAARVEAAFLVRRGADPGSAISAGRSALAEALRLKPDSADSYVEAARLELVEASWEASAGREVSVRLRAAHALAEQAIERDEQFAGARLAAAEACLQLARVRSSPSAIEPGLAHVSHALTLNPRLREAREVRAKLSRLRAS